MLSTLGHLWQGWNWIVEGSACVCRLSGTPHFSALDVNSTKNISKQDKIGEEGTHNVKGGKLPLSVSLHQTHSITIFTLRNEKAQKLVHRILHILEAKYQVLRVYTVIIPSLRRPGLNCLKHQSSLGETSPKIIITKRKQRTNIQTFKSSLCTCHTNLPCCPNYKTFSHLSLFFNI